MPVLHVEGGDALEVLCDYRDGRWWFVWADGREIASVADFYGAVRVICGVRA
ncbi:hypothetical protein [Actinomadura vinacea]|uniref:hypothetical protein n=1 Tax=Actinomadura vinacea TaxID=115336 RepID=UPI0031E388CA